MIEIRQLNKSFDSLCVLRNIDVTIESGMIYGIIGRSGTGKSTLLRCINGLEGYDSGELIVDGVDVKSLEGRALREFRKSIGMIFQQFSLLERLTVYENVALPLKSWKYDKAFIDKRVKELLQMVGIPDKIDAYPRELSGGQKQRVAIARALTMNPKILLCDEATSALDPKTAKAITALLCQINRDMGITIIIVTHQMSVLRAACEEITILEKGNVAAQGLVEQIFMEQPRCLQNLIGQKDIIVPETGTTLKILLASQDSDTPIITQMARDLGVNFIILGGEMDSYRGRVLGSVMINVPQENIESVCKYLAARHVVWDEIRPNSEDAGEGEENIYV